jgi:hypothetical protein
MIPIQNKDTFIPNGGKLKTLTLDPFCFMFNSIAMGDVVAAVPVVKHMVENYYTEPSSYYVVTKAHFRCLFPFVPDANWRDYDKKDEFWGMPSVLLGLISTKNSPGVTRLTPKHMHLSQFASLKLADRILADKYLNYVPLDTVDLSHLENSCAINFKNTVVLVTSYRDLTRMWNAEEILKVAKWLQSKGITPVFVGKTDMEKDIREGIIPKSALPEDISEYGLDLRNKTSIPELASIFKQAKAVCGLDSGPIHLAGTTSIPIICGYTSISPEHRIPHRLEGKTYPIVPEMECISCESRWRTNFHNFENCYFGHADCCKLMTANRFINVLETIL